MSEPFTGPGLSEPEIRRRVSEIAGQTARDGEAAFRLGLRALGDRSYMVRYRACMVLAYSLRPAAFPALEALRSHADARTREDAERAIDAFVHRNHHYFVDRDHSGQTRRVVDESDGARD